MDSHGERPLGCSAVCHPCCVDSNWQWDIVGENVVVEKKPDDCGRVMAWLGALCTIGMSLLCAYRALYRTRYVFTPDSQLTRMYLNSNDVVGREWSYAGAVMRKTFEGDGDSTCDRYSAFATLSDGSELLLCSCLENPAWRDLGPNELKAMVDAINQLRHNVRTSVTPS